MRALLALLACVWLCMPAVATGTPRFGDSTWVAPSAPIAGDPASEGPRVAAPDHERGWETALRAPFRVAFFPLRVVAIGAEAAAGRFGGQFLDPHSPRPPGRRITIAPSLDATSAEDVGAGPALRWTGFPVAGGTLAIRGAWSTIDRREVHVRESIAGAHRLGFLLGADYDSRPNHRFDGIGNESRRADQAFYLLETVAAEAAVLYGRSPLRQLRLLGGLSTMSPRRATHGSPSLETHFDPAQAPFEHTATRELTYGMSGDLAALDTPRDPSLGVHTRGELRRAIGARSQDPDFTQWWLEGRAYTPILAHRRVLAVRGVYAGIDPTGNGTPELPFYRLIASTGPTRLAGYADERFRDRQLILARAEYRWEVFMRLSAIALLERGAVAPSAAAFTLRTAHTSWGGGLRISLSEASVVRLEVAKSVEGTHAFVVLGSDF